MTHKAPFPYFGGKSKVADIVWQKLGQPDHYIEPFFGSGAVLLARPEWTAEAGFTETVNDRDGFVANVWRGIQFDPDLVAHHCDWPVNHADLIARKKYLIEHEDYLLNGLVDDPKWFDAELAGYWIWAASIWIGSGLTYLRQLPHIAHKGSGGAKASLGKRPNIASKGSGVAKASLGKRPNIANKGSGVTRINIKNWFNELSERLRRVRVVCGDWSRVCGGNWQDSHWRDVGIFFDPPYGVENRSELYHKDSRSVASDVMDWCVERGMRKNYRIVIAGYEEHSDLVENHGWAYQKWKANDGYGNMGENRVGKNKKRETLYFSPHCAKDRQMKLFGV